MRHVQSKNAAEDVDLDSLPDFFSLRTLAFAAALFLLNAYVCRELFVTEYTHHMGSIEAAYISISRYVVGHVRDLTWFPLWYCGIPYQNSYPPLLHLLVAWASWVFSWSPALAHHALTAAFYCLGPVTLFYLAYALSRNRSLSFATSLLYSVVSPSAFLMSSVAVDLESLWRARRLQTLVTYGDGPHVSSMTLIPLAVLALDIALRRRGPFRIYAASLALASVVLTNWLGAFALTMAVLSYLLARSDEPRWFRALTVAAGIGLLAYSLACPWIPPSTIGDIQRNAQHVIGRYPMTVGHLMHAGLLTVAVLVLRWIHTRLKTSLCLRFSSYFLLFMAGLALTSEWFDIYLMPQPERYHLEMEMAVCLVAIFGAASWLRRIPTRYRNCFVAALLVLVAVQLRTYRHFARDLIHPIDIRETVEYQVARWLDQNLPNQRVFATGSVQFWLNVFADNPQVGGGFGQGTVNPQIPVVHFGVPFTKNDGDITALWLRLYGAKGVVVSGPEGRDAYGEAWRDPAKFQGVLPRLWRDGEDAIYGVLQRSQSLAHVILPQHVVKRPPINNVDLEPVREFDAALEDPSLPLAQLVWERPHKAVVRAELAREHLVAAQISYHPGWRALVNDEARRIVPDGLGFMIIEPRCEGACEIELVYDGGLEMRVAKLACGLSIVGGILWLSYVRWKRRKSEVQHQ